MFYRILCLTGLFFLNLNNLHAAEITITSLGAISSDGSDDLGAIQSAIDSASSGDSVLIPAGIWNISGTINLRSGIALTGAGKDLSTILFESGTIQPMIEIDSDDANASAPVQISKLTLDANNDNHCSQGISATSISNVLIDSVRVKNLVQSANTFGPHGIHFTSTVTDSQITNCELINIGVNSEWGAGVRISDQSARIQVIGNTIQQTGRGGILLNDRVIDTTISNNKITQIGLHSEGLGIEIFSECDRAIVEDNTLDHWLSLDNSDFVAVRRNTIGGDHLTDTKFASLEAAGLCEYCVFADNVTGQGNHIGISISNDTIKRHILWLRNSISKAGTWGAQIQGDTTGAFRMYFRENRFEQTINSPTSLFKAGGPGFRINENAREIVFDQNVFSNNQGVGMQIFTDPNSPVPLDHLSFIGNTIENNQDTSIEIENEDTIPNITWSNNTILNNNPDNALIPTVPNSSIPSATINGPDTILVGQSINYTFSYQGNGIEPDTVVWDFSDGLPTNLHSPNKNYQTPGQYKIALVVWDNSGRAAFAEKTINVVTTDAIPPIQHSFVEIDGENYLALAYPRPTGGSETNNLYETTQEVYLVDGSTDLITWDQQPISIPTDTLPTLPFSYEWGQLRYSSPVSETAKAYLRLQVTPTNNQ